MSGRIVKGLSAKSYARWSQTLNLNHVIYAKELTSKFAFVKIRIFIGKKAIAIIAYLFFCIFCILQRKQQLISLLRN